MSSYNVVKVTPGTAYKQVTTWETNGSVNVGPNQVFANGFDYESVEMQSSVNTPGYETKRRLGVTLPQLPYERLSTKWTNGQMQGIVESWSTSTSFRARDTYYGPAHLIVGSNSDDNSYVGDDPTDLATSRLLAQASLSKASLGVGLAEASKTASHIAASATRIVKAAIALKNLRFLEFANVLGVTNPAKAQRKLNRNYRRARDRWTRDKVPHGTRNREFFAQSWLEYTYAWRPLVQDAFDQAENLSNFLLDRSPALRYAQGTAKTVKTYSEVTQVHPMWTNRRICTTTNRVRIGVWFTARVDPIASFGLNNPALIAWELMPFSFVVDWFLPIGAFLESLTATHGLQFHGGFKVLKRELHVEGLHVPTFATISGSFGSANRQKYTGSVVNSFNIKNYKRREVLSTFPSLGFPRLKDPRSFAHAASAIALLQVVFLGKSSVPSYVRQ